MKYTKYTIDESTRNKEGLARIVALRDIDRFNVKRGDIGGWVKSYYNLHQKGDCWIGGNAKVYEEAIVYGYSHVYGDAKVHGYSRVTGDCTVAGNAEVAGNAIIYGKAIVSGYSLVCANARVFGNTCVNGDAEVYGHSEVYGDSLVHGNAVICGYAEVYGSANVHGNAKIKQKSDIFLSSNVGTENGTLTVYKTKDGILEVTRGCFVGTVEEFLAASKAKHDDKTHREYQLLIEVAKSRILYKN